MATGFQSGTDTQTGYNRMRARATEELMAYFRPEFLNRVDDVIVFPQLTRDEVIEIVDMFVGWLEKWLADKDMGIELTPAAKVLLRRKHQVADPGRTPPPRVKRQTTADRRGGVLKSGVSPHCPAGRTAGRGGVRTLLWLARSHSGTQWAGGKDA
ncbi:UNVERIFIED_ORG: hypothetical protein ABIB52_004379 [Arthrobacter sp. UYCu721]